MRFELTIALHHMMSRKLVSGLVSIILGILGLFYLVDMCLSYDAGNRVAYLSGLVLIISGVSAKIIMEKRRSALYSNISRFIFFVLALLFILLGPHYNTWDRIAFILGPFFLILGVFVKKDKEDGSTHNLLISIISVITILGVVLGVMALIMVIAVMDGAQEDYKTRLLNQYAHIEISAPRFGGRMQNYRALMDLVAKDPDVLAVSPVLKHYALLKFTNDFFDMSGAAPSQILGIDPDLEAKVSIFGLDNENLVGKRVPGDYEIVVGNKLSQRLGLQCGDQIIAVTGEVHETAQGFTPQRVPLKVVGIFKTGLYEVDMSVSYVSIPTLQAILFPLEDVDVVDLVHMRLTDPLLASRVEERLELAIRKQLGTRLRIMTWEELNPALFAALKLEKLAMFIILMLVIVVAGMNIIGTLILVTLEKTREIGILRAIGTSRRSISLTFILEGGLIGCIGTVLGIIFGLLGSYYLKYYCPIEIPEAVYGLDGLPVQVKAATVFLIALCSMGICLLSAVIPATIAARLNIVEALRYE